MVATTINFDAACLLAILYFPSALNFVTFGEGVGDNKHVGGNDANAFTLRLPVPIMFFRKYQTELYVRSNSTVSIVMIIILSRYQQMV